VSYQADVSDCGGPKANSGMRFPSDGSSAGALPRVHVVILNWNGWENTSVCLSSVQQLDYENRHVVVVDNGSTDESAAYIRREFPNVELIETGINLGFAGGCNAGIRRAMDESADYVWLLNNDTRVSVNALRALVDRAERDPQ